MNGLGQHMEDLHDLVDRVIEQIKKDFDAADETALVELLLSIPRGNLEAYLPEELK